MDIAILGLRLLLAATLFAHAAQKTLGWFQGLGLTGMVPVFERMGQRPARQMIVLAAVMELIAAASLVLGLLAPLGGAICAGTMLVAAASQTLTSKALWNAQGGGEYPFVLGVLGIVVASSGGGRFALDRAADLPWTDPTTSSALLLALGSLLLAVLAAVVPISRTRRNLVAARTAGHRAATT